MKIVNRIFKLFDKVVFSEAFITIFWVIAIISFMFVVHEVVKGRFSFSLGC